jgi:hypothetical protein
MGHEAAINKDNYQCPVGFKEVRVMGGMLGMIDGGNLFNQLSPIYLSTKNITIS